MAQSPFNFPGQSLPTLPYTPQPLPQIEIAAPRHFSVNPPNRPFTNHVAVIGESNTRFVNGYSEHLGLSSRSHYILVVLAFVTIGFLVSAWLLLQDLIGENQLNQTGTQTQAQLVNIGTTTGRFGIQSYHVTYTFTLPNPASISGSDFYIQDQLVDEAAYNAYRNSSTITIEYARSNPSVSEILGQSEISQNVSTQAVITLAIVVFMGFMVWKLFQDWQLNKLLEREGYLIEGHLVGSSIRRFRGGKTLRVEVVFTDPTGKPLRARYRFIYLSFQKPPQDLTPGERIGVVYYDSKHFKVM